MRRTLVPLLAVGFLAILSADLPADKAAPQLRTAGTAIAQIGVTAAAVAQPVLYRAQQDVFLPRHLVYRPGVDRFVARNPIYQPDIDRLNIYDLKSRNRAPIAAKK